MNTYRSAIEPASHETNTCRASWANGKLVLEIDPECELFAALAQLASESQAAGDEPRSRLFGRNSDFRFDPINRIATYRGREVCLSRTEATLVEILWRADSEVVPYSRLVTGGWGHIDRFQGNELVRSHLRNIRHKFVAAGLPASVIETIRGHGARIALPESEPAA